MELNCKIRERCYKYDAAINNDLIEMCPNSTNRPFCEQLLYAYAYNRYENCTNTQFCEHAYMHTLIETAQIDHFVNNMILLHA
jgi:hypothetical protein